MAMPATMSHVELDHREAARWRWTNMALDRLAEHPFTEREVLTAVLAPLTVERAQKPGLWLHKRGACAVVVDPDKRLVITVLDTLAGQRPPRRIYSPPPSRPALSVVNPARVAPVADEQAPIDPRSVKNMAERIRLLNAGQCDTVPAIVGDWIPSVCLPRLRDYPGRWAVILVAPHAKAASVWAGQVSESHSDLETAVRGMKVYARYVVQW